MGFFKMRPPVAAPVDGTAIMTMLPRWSAPKWLEQSLELSRSPLGCIVSCRLRPLPAAHPLLPKNPFPCSCLLQTAPASHQGATMYFKKPSRTSHPFRASADGNDCDCRASRRPPGQGCFTAATGSQSRRALAEIGVGIREHLPGKATPGKAPGLGWGVNRIVRGDVSLARALRSALLRPRGAAAATAAAWILPGSRGDQRPGCSRAHTRQTRSPCWWKLLGPALRKGERARRGVELRIL